MLRLNGSHTALAIAFVVLATSIGCSSTEQSTMPTTIEGSPGWIDRPNGLYEEGNARVVFAVGIAADNPNPAARRNQAISRGRTELARTLQTQVQSLVKDYMEVNRDFYAMDSASSQEYYEDISRQVTDETLVGSRQVMAWRDPADNTLYVLMRLDFDDVISEYKAQMQQAYAREAQRKRIKASADAFEDQLDEQIEKLHDREVEMVNELLGTGS